MNSDSLFKLTADMARIQAHAFRQEPPVDRITQVGEELQSATGALLDLARHANAEDATRIQHIAGGMKERCAAIEALARLRAAVHGTDRR